MWLLSSDLQFITITPTVKLAPTVNSPRCLYTAIFGISPNYM